VLTLGIIETVAVVLLGVLVARLLRSHGDILRQLQPPAPGVGGPEDNARIGGPEDNARVGGSPVPISTGRSRVAGGAAPPDVAGVTPAGVGIALSPGRVGGHTLLAFLSSGCGACATFWQALAAPAHLGLPPDVRVVVVTKGPESEHPGELVGRLGPAVPLVMSTDAWANYDIPGSPYFVLVDGNAGRRVGGGGATRFDQVAELVRRAGADAGPPTCPAPTESERALAS